MMRKVSEFLKRSRSSRLCWVEAASKTTVLIWRMLVSAPKPRKKSRMGNFLEVPVLVGQLDEDVFEAGGEGADIGDANVTLEQGGPEGVEIDVVFDEGVDGLPENSSAAKSGNLANETEGSSDFRSVDFDAPGAAGLEVGKLLELLGAAVGDEFAEINVGYVIAALRFVHVVSGDEERDAVRGEIED